MNRVQLLKDAARALSLANLLFIGAWVPVLDTRYNLPEKFAHFGFLNVLSLILNVLILGTMFFAGVTIIRHYQKRTGFIVARALFILTFLCALTGILCAHNPWFDARAAAFRVAGYFNPTEARLLGTLIITLGSLFLLRRLNAYRFIVIALCVLLWMPGLDEVQSLGFALLFLFLATLFAARHWLSKVAAATVLILFPFFIFNLFQGARLLVAHSGSVKPAPLVSQSTNLPRVVWIVFDEMSYDLAFSKRPPGVALEAFDNLRSQSLQASNAYPPASYTLVSMPALITGRLISAARPTGPAELQIRYDGTEQFASLGAQENIFTAARGMGANVALVGWYLPYDRLFGDSLNDCRAKDTHGLSLSENMFLHLKALLSWAPKSWSYDNAFEGKRARWRRRALRDGFIELLTDAKNVAADSRFALTLIHLPVPHPPGLYKRDSGAYDAEGESSYLDNLALADRALGEIRQAMEAAGLWQEATVLVTSDHWWRTHIWRDGFSWTQEDDQAAAVEAANSVRVPFLLKLPDQQLPVVYEPPFNTVLTHDLLLSILRRDIRTAEEAKNWLERNRSIAESPYYYESLTYDPAP